MTDDGHAPTIPDTQVPTHGPGAMGMPRPPDARYALRALLGKGGMGEVWLAHDTRVDRDIAVKLMRGSKDPDAVARFLREARVQGRLEHPSVVPVHDLGGDETAPFFAMKRLTGTTLAEVIATRDQMKWPRRTLLARFIDICLAIEFAHKRGVIHRDLKPANLMLGDYGETYVLDWGLARIADDSDSGVIRNSDLRGDSDVGQTEVGAMLGTPGYMAPEQMRGEAVDQRADVYALGCLLFEILVGEPAIARDRTLEVTLSAVCHHPLERSIDVPPELDDVCARATQAELTNRTASAREVADAVQRFLDGDRDLERRRELAAEHAARAHLLLKRGDNDARAEAMREAGSAIALDASNQDGKHVLARLLLDPPAEMPPQVGVKLDEERQRVARTMMAAGTWIYLAFGLLLPLLKVLGLEQTWPLIVVGALSGLIALICAVATRLRWRVNAALGVTILVTHGLLLVAVGIILGPLVLSPLLVFGTFAMFSTVGVVRLPKVIFAVHLATLAVPLALEWLSVTPASYHFDGNALVLKPWAVDIAPRAILFLIVTMTVMQLLTNAIVLGAQRRLKDRAQEQLHIQKWQLEQLVPSSGSSS